MTEYNDIDKLVALITYELVSHFILFMVLSYLVIILIYIIRYNYPYYYKVDFVLRDYFEIVYNLYLYLYYIGKNLS